jgi:hypothetical protein
LNNIWCGYKLWSLSSCNVAERCLNSANCSDWLWGSLSLVFNVQ